MQTRMDTEEKGSSVSLPKMQECLLEPAKEERKMSTPTVIDIFGAPGGMSEGFKQAGFKILAAIDNFEWGCRTLECNHPDTLVLNEDVTKVDIPALKNKIDGTGIDVLIGGPPCQGFSLVGRPKIASLNGNKPGKLKDPRNKLYKTYFKFVETLKPEFFVMENVQGILSLHNGKVRDDILGICDRLGYSVDFKVLNAADYGVPQARKRVFFVGNKSGARENPFPEPTHAAKNGNKNNSKLKPCVTVSDAISDLPPLEVGEGKEELEYTTKNTTTPYQKEMRKSSGFIYSHVARPHNNRDIGIFKLIRKGHKYSELPKNLKPYRCDIFKDKYNVLDSKKPSRTIVAHLSKDGLGFIHPRQNRSITVREAARLQSFPDRFRFMGSRTWQFIQVGNAVPPKLAKAIASHIKNYL